MKQKICKICKEPYTPQRIGQKVCSIPCAKEDVAQKNKKEFRRETRAAKKKIKPKSEYMREAQQAFNRYIRLRDASLPCISCGTMANVQYAAGHYRTVAAAGHLRFDERNVHKQCNRNCNEAKSGNIVEYRKGLVGRIGLAEVEALENDYRVKSWDIEELKEIKKKYVKMAKEIEILDKF